jgi:3',5'-cyclic AMP phosphodiesterase CpdA
MNVYKNFFVPLFTVCVILFLHLSFSTISCNAQTKPDTLSFIHITDPHIIYNLPGYHPNIEKARKHFADGINPLEQIIKSFEKIIKPDFVIITGDLIDFYEAETINGKMLDTQIEQFIHLLDMSYLPMYLALGNHDISSDYVKNNSYGTRQYNAERARAAWIRNTTCFKDGTYYSRDFKVDKSTYRFIFLDNGYSPVETIKNDEVPFYIDRSQLDWLDNQIRESVTDIEIIFMHIPLPESDSVTAKLLYKDSSGTGFNNVLSLLKKYSSAHLIFAGHNHKNIINEFYFPDNYKLTQVQTAAFGYDPKNWRLIQLTGEKIIISSPGDSSTQYTISIR